MTKTNGYTWNIDKHIVQGDQTCLWAVLARVDGKQ
jgi:hypothetical protein